VCGHVYMYIYACVYVFVHLCVYTHVYVYVYAYLCIDCGSQYHCFGVWTVLCMHVCVRVHMYAYAYGCGYIYMCIFFAVSVACTLQVFWALVHASTVFGKHCECNAHKFTYLRRLPPLGSHLLLLSLCVLTHHEGQKKLYVNSRGSNYQHPSRATSF